MSEASEATSSVFAPAMIGVEIGHGLGIVGPRTVALFEPMNAALAAKVWSLVSSGAGANELLEVVSGEGLRTLGAFAFAHREDGALHVVVRQTASAEISDGDQSEVVAAGNVRTWVEKAFGGDATFCLRLAEADAEFQSPFRVVSGLVPAIALHSAPPEVADLGVVTTTPLVDPAAILIAPPASAAEPVVQVTQPELPPQAAPVVEAVAASPQPALPPPAVEPIAPLDVHATLAQPTDDEAALIPSPVAEVAVDSMSPYDDIYGATVARSVQMAAVAAHDAPEGLIDEVPPDGAAATPAAERPGDHDGRTITRAQLGALRGVGSGAATPVEAHAGGAIVQASLCASQHPNPPAAGLCRVCGGAVSPTLVNVVRPPLGVLRFSTGAQTRLERPLLIGRNPKVSGMMGTELPEAVQLDVGSGLSRTHLAVRLEGWQVLVEDLNSANGTVVSLPGQLPRRLHPGEPVLLEPGASVDLGGDASFEFALR